MSVTLLALFQVKPGPGEHYRFCHDCYALLLLANGTTTKKDASVKKYFNFQGNKEDFLSWQCSVSGEGIVSDTRTSR